MVCYYMIIRCLLFILFFTFLLKFWFSLYSFGRLLIILIRMITLWSFFI